MWLSEFQQATFSDQMPQFVEVSDQSEFLENVNRIFGISKQSKKSQKLKVWDGPVQLYNGPLSYLGMKEIVVCSYN